MGRRTRIVCRPRSCIPAPTPLPGGDRFRKSILRWAKFPGTGILAQGQASNSRPGRVATGPVGVESASFVLAPSGHAGRSRARGTFHPDGPDGCHLHRDLLQNVHQLREKRGGNSPRKKHCQPLGQRFSFMSPPQTGTNPPSNGGAYPPDARSDSSGPVGLLFRSASERAQARRRMRVRVRWRI